MIKNWQQFNESLVSDTSKEQTDDKDIQNENVNHTEETEQTETQLEEPTE